MDVQMFTDVFHWTCKALFLSYCNFPSDATSAQNMALWIRAACLPGDSNSFASLILGWDRSRQPLQPVGPCGAGGSQPSLKEKVKLLVNNVFPIVEEGHSVLGGCLGSFCRRHF